MTATARAFYEKTLSYDQLRIRARGCFIEAAIKDDNGDADGATRCEAEGHEFNRLAEIAKREMAA